MAEVQPVIDACRDALRIPADVYDYDVEIEDLIAAARAAMCAGGVSPKMASDDADGTVRLAIKVFCKAHFGMDNPDAERYARTFLKHLVLAIASSICLLSELHRL